jgi:hypothetical protein
VLQIRYGSRKARLGVFVEDVSSKVLGVCVLVDWLSSEWQ